MSKNGVTKERIVAVSEDYFSKYGFSGTSMSDIAKAIGIQKSSLYSHFESKESLFLEVFQRIHDTAASDISDIFFNSAYSNKEKLYHMFLVFCNNSRVEIFQKGMHPNPECQEQVIKIHTDFENNFRSILATIFQSMKQENCISDRANENLCDVFFFLINGVMFKTSIYTKEEYPEKVELAWNTFCEWAKIK